MILPINAATINLTQNCNLNCSYCFNGNKTAKEMPYETAVKCIDFMFKEALDANINNLPGKQKQIEVQFWGGEPLLKWDMIKDLVLYAENSKYKDIRVNFSGTTNGTLLTPEKFDFMDEHQMYFMVSLDGTPETHNYNRKYADGRGSQEVIMENMKPILKRWPNIQVRMSAFPERIDHFFEDIQYLVASGIINIVWSPVYEAAWSDDNWIIWEDQLYKTVNFLIALAKQGKQLNLANFIREEVGCHPCGAGRQYVGFDVDGSIYICHRFSKFTDDRPWQEKENCIGHVDIGITRPEVRKSLQNEPQKQGCPAVNFDICKNMKEIPINVRFYDMMMKKLRNYNANQLNSASPQQVMNYVRSLEERIKKLEEK